MAPWFRRASPAGGGLSARGVAVHFAGVRALDGVDLDLAQGQILGLIGPNGAGKTTLLNVLSGFQRPTSGTLRLDGEDVTGRSPVRLARAGVVRTFQNVRLFSRLTVEENVEAGASGAGASPREARRRARELLRRFGLADRADSPADGLPYGDERRLGIARALAASPRFLMLDEPAAGMNEAESDQLLDTLLAVRETDGCGMLVVEHDMRLMMRLCEGLQVLDYGQTLAVGRPEEVRRDRRVLEAYLGAEEADAVDHGRAGGPG